MAIAGRHTVDITTAALAIFTYDQMDQVRAELNGVSKQTLGSAGQCITADSR